MKLKVSILAGIIIAGLVGVLAYFITLEDTISNATIPLEISPVNLTYKEEGMIELHNTHPYSKHLSKKMISQLLMGRRDGIASTSN